MADLDKPTTFPGIFAWDLYDYFPDNLDEADQFVLRPVRPEDPSRTVGIVAEDWEPSPNAYETGRDEPLLGQYVLTIWAFVKHLNEEEGIQEHGVLARNIRRMLAGDTTLLGTLRAEVDDYGTGTEYVQRIRLVNQKFLSNEVNGTHMYLSVSRLMIETESY